MNSSFPSPTRTRALLQSASCVLLLSLCWLSAHATAAEPPGQALVRSTAESFLQQLRADAAANAADPTRILTSAETMVLPHFDFQLISRRALGRHWRDFTPEQRARFAQEFRTLLLRTYANTLNDYRDSKITFLAPRQLSAEALRVRTEVTRPNGGPPYQIDYEVRQLAEGWKICDVTLSGVSLIISYRAGFAKDIAALGAEGVIAQLVARNQASSS
jgi:phospholipid transport system substrate-binding protein